MIEDENNSTATPSGETPVAPSMTTSSAAVSSAPIKAPVARVWSAISVPFLAIFAATIVSAVVLIIGVIALSIQVDPSNPDNLLPALFDHPLGIWIAVLPGQLTFLAVTVFATELSPVDAISRLRLSKGSLPVWTWFVFLVSTPCIGILTSLVIEGLGIEPSAHLKMLEDLLASQKGLAFVASIFLVAILPGFAEELLFRGYMQSRLLLRWSPWAAVLLSAFVFAVAHIDPLHVCAVLPLGIWLGLIAYRCESIWPAILCHFGNNLLSLVLVQLQFEFSKFGILELCICIPSIFAVLWSLLLIFRTAPSSSSLERA